MKKHLLTALLLSLVLILSGCKQTAPSADDTSVPLLTEASSSCEITGKMDLQYAEQFSVEYRSDGCAEISCGSEKFLFVPENLTVPAENTLPVLHEAHKNIYLAASSAMDLFFALGAEDCIEFTSTSSSNWSIPAVKKSVEEDDIFYVGKYSAPDYEFLVSEGCCAAIESTMINHSPEVREKLISLGIPVFTERSSYESHPLGRLEWIRLWGLLTGRQNEADAFFSDKTKTFEEVQKNVSSVTDRKSAAFFYITSAGYVNVRKPGDYVSKMIELAGGEYSFTGEELGTGEHEMSTLNMQMEDFYSKAKDADFIIYNSTIDGTLNSTDELIQKSELFMDFKAVKEGHVYCTGQNMFQQTSECADMIKELNLIFSDDTETELRFLKKLD